MEGEKVLVFFKTKPTVITQDNMQSLLVSSMVDSPIASLYHALQTLYAPVLLQVGWGGASGVGDDSV